MVVSLPMGTERVPSVLPSTESVTSATARRVRRPPKSSTRTTICAGWPTMAKRAALTMLSLRSRSPRWPAISTCSGAFRAICSGGGASWTSPSVIRMAPAMRAGGTSASAAFSAAKAWVPLFSPLVVVVTLGLADGQVGLAGKGLADLRQRLFRLWQRDRRCPCSANGPSPPPPHRAAAHGFRAPAWAPPARTAGWQRPGRAPRRRGRRT